LRGHCSPRGRFPERSQTRFCYSRFAWRLGATCPRRVRAPGPGFPERTQSPPGRPPGTDSGWGRTGPLQVGCRDESEVALPSVIVFEVKSTL
jgi:hypothetical protein